MLFFLELTTPQKGFIINSIYGLHFIHIVCFHSQEGRTIVENRTADIIQETRKLNIKKKSSIPESQSASSNGGSGKQLQQMHTQTQRYTQTDIEIQLKASRDVRCQPCITGLHI